MFPQNSLNKLERIRKIIFILGIALILGSRWVVLPAGAQEKMFIMPIDPAQSWFVYNLDPGKVLNDKVLITNNSDKIQKVKIIPVDAEATSSGLFALKSKQSAQIGVGGWITINDPIFSLGPKEHKTCLFTINIPKDTPPGDYAGGLIVIPYDDEVNVEDTSKKGTGISTVINVGVRVYVNVSGQVNIDFKWDDFSQQFNDKDQSLFMFNFSNNGNVAIEAKGEMQLQSLFFKPTSIPIDLGVVYSGKSTNPKVTWKSPFPFGRVTATTSIHYTRANVFGALEDNSDQGGDLEKILSFWIIPYKEVGVSFLVFFMIFGILAYRYQRSMALLKNCKPYISPIEESITSIAQKYGISWKVLAKINKIKFPFIVHENQSILIPFVNNTSNNAVANLQNKSVIQSQSNPIPAPSKEIPVTLSVIPPSIPSAPSIAPNPSSISPNSTIPGESSGSSQAS
ncbi:MAG: hypothetical protein UT36_C0001G0202 [Candidatus Peregrinibacteria bacterium GW2011_GWF2_39_17]|nr:MAG: hypothetical protein UT36_C0001G0202 [Candidatus Peregrinibacteria bacterium GW2011_GWF2_39_17]HCW32640.1 hypothetical protein [Candidatus Peregrinibacteria bacterium]